MLEISESRRRESRFTQSALLSIWLDAVTPVKEDASLQIAKRQRTDENKTPETPRSLSDRLAEFRKQALTSPQGLVDYSRSPISKPSVYGAHSDNGFATPRRRVPLHAPAATGSNADGSLRSLPGVAGAAAGGESGAPPAAAAAASTASSGSVGAGRAAPASARVPPGSALRSSPRNNSNGALPSAAESAQGSPTAASASAPAPSDADMPSSASADPGQAQGAGLHTSSPRGSRGNPRSLRKLF